MKRSFTIFLLAAGASAAPVDFVREVRPIFEEHCYKCHGAEKQKSSLRLDVKSEAMKGGESHAPNILPGHGAKSPLVQFVAGEDPDLLMPPKGARLSAEQVATLERWIDEGAVWPEDADAVKLADKRDWWSFKPLPTSFTQRSIDGFVSAKLAEKGLAMSPEADRRTLIRRLSLLLDGLPPTPEETDAFVRDPDPRAYEKLVDRLLASPRYGEKWARHWLDVIAFGETHGFEVNTPRDNAWPYRDYVIDAFNKDTPYPRFILEQLAGDSLDLDAATGFIVARAALLPGQIGKDEESKAKARQDELNDMVSIAGGAFLGLTLHCARCHDHKFDPISQTDYYGLQAIFAGVRHGDRPLVSREEKIKDVAAADLQPKVAAATHRLAQFEPLASAETGAARKRLPVSAHRNIDRFAPVLTQKLRFTVLATSENNLREPCLDELEIYSTDGRNVALATNGATVRASDENVNSKHLPAHLIDGRYGNERSWFSRTKGGCWVEVQFAQAERIDTAVWGRDRLDKYTDRLAVSYRLEAARDDGTLETVATSGDRLEKKPRSDQPANLSATDLGKWQEARATLGELERKLGSTSAGPMVYAGRFEPPAPSFRLHRGEAMQKKEEVAPSAVTGLGAPLKLPADTPEQARRIAFAKWLADPANPLPARVLVNRLWQQHFGEGLVSTPNDFGRNGAQPSNPQLLDWLASEFIRGGWSIKHLQRLIVTSAAWKQASSANAKALQIDADNRLLWRFPARRIDAETLRDEMLAVAGTLDLRTGGPGFSVFAPNSNYVRVYDPKPEFGPPEWRRMIYMTKVRVAQDSTFGAFDCPDAGQAQPKRPRSTTAIQALSLFNSNFVMQQAELLATRVQREAGGDIAKQAQRAFALAMLRGPEAAESRVCELLVREHGLPALCRVLFNANEFLFLP